MMLLQGVVILLNMLSLTVGDCSSHLDYQQQEPSKGMHVICAYASEKTPGVMVVKGLEHAYTEFFMSHHGDSGDIIPLLNGLYDVLGNYLYLLRSLNVSRISSFRLTLLHFITTVITIFHACMYVCMSICLSVCLSVCLSSLVCLFRLFACLLWHLGRTSLLRWKSNTRYSGVPLSGSCTAVEISNRTARSQMS